MRSRRIWRAMNGAGLAMVTVGLVASCASPRAVLNTSQSSCYRAIPAAADAVSHQGRFAGLRRISVGANQAVPLGAGLGLPRRTTTTTVLPATGQATPTSVSSQPRAACMVAFRGTFEPVKIPLLRGLNRTGHYAVVVVGLRTGQARAVYLVDRLPGAFSHL